MRKCKIFHENDLPLVIISIFGYKLWNNEKPKLYFIRMRIQNAKCYNAYRTSSPQTIWEHNKLFLTYFFCRLQDYNKLSNCVLCMLNGCFYFSFYVQGRCQRHINPIAKNENSRFVSVHQWYSVFVHTLCFAIGSQNGLFVSTKNQVHLQ